MRRLISLIAVVAVALSATAETLEGYLRIHGRDVEPGFGIAEVASRAETDPDFIGVWQLCFDGDSGLFALVRDPFTGYIKMIVVDAVARNVPPGTLMGVMCRLAATDTYDAQIFSSVDRHGRLSSPKRFTLRLTPSNALTFKPVNRRWTANWWRLIPYMGRISIRHIDDRDRDIDGAVRIFPPSKSGTETPHLL